METGELRESDQVTSHDDDPAHDGGALHRPIAEQLAVELGRRGDVEAVLLAGSVARGESRPCSDVDLLVVGPDSSTLAARVVVDGLLVERIAHSEAGWTLRLDRPRTSWA